MTMTALMMMMMMMTMVVMMMMTMMMEMAASDQVVGSEKKAADANGCPVDSEGDDTNGCLAVKSVATGDRATRAKNAR